MATENEGGRTRRKTGRVRDDGERAGRPVEEAAGPARAIPMVDIDPWGSFLERFWEQAEGGSADGQDGGRKPAEVVRTPSAKPGRKERSPRAS
jgi:hypothetical protein